MKFLITGASGMVGSYLADCFAPMYELLLPSHADLDITNRESAMAYVIINIPEVIIHAAGFTDPKKAEGERGDEGGKCYQTNVLGTRYIKEASRRIGAFFIHISTGSVFFGNETNPGPFTESAPLPVSLGLMSWYGWTKVLSEKEAGESSAIIRLSKPLGLQGKNMTRINYASSVREKFSPPTGGSNDISHERHFLSRLGKRDYLGKLLYEYENHTLAGLMDDQYFPLVSMDEVARVLRWIIEHKSSGVYHAASPDMTTPFELVQYALGGKGEACLRRQVLRIKPQRFDEFITTQELPLRHQKYSAIASTGTVVKTGVRFMGWREVVDYRL